MLRHSARTRWLHVISAALVIGAAGARLVSAGLPASALQAEALLLLVGLAYAAVAIWFRLSRWSEVEPLGRLVTAGSVLLAVGFLLIVAPYLSDIVPLAVIIFVSIFLGIDLTLPRRHVQVTIAIPAVSFGGLCAFAAVLLHQSPGYLLVWGLMLGGVVMTAYVDWKILQDRIKLQVGRLNAIAGAAQRLGVATDYTAVASAILQAARDSYPAANYGGVLLYDPATDRLRSLPVSLGKDGVGEPSQGQPVDLGPDEGLAGQVFQSGEARAWRTIDDFVTGHAGTPAEQRKRIQAMVGVVKSAVGAPLRTPDRGVIGVLVLGSSERERVFSSEDVRILQGLADQAALGLERARLYQEQRTQAMTDGLTGLANFRQLEQVLNQELARARRADGQMGVIFCDLDGFKAVNDAFGHSVGDAALRLFATTLLEVLRAEDTAARYGGDEFVCVLPGADLDHARAIGDRIQGHFEAKRAENPELRLLRTQASVGIAVYPDDGTTADRLLAAADANLIGGKGGLTGEVIPLSPPGGGSIHIYTPRHQAPVAGVLEEPSTL